MADALRRWFADGARASDVVFAAGPSRTADIEQKMLLGVNANAVAGRRAVRIGTP